MTQKKTTSSSVTGPLDTCKLEHCESPELYNKLFIFVPPLGQLYSNKLLEQVVSTKTGYNISWPRVNRKAQEKSVIGLANMNEYMLQAIKAINSMN